MTSSTSAAAPASPFDALPPLRLPPDLRLTHEQFEQVCAANREAVLELDAHGHLIAMTPTGSETSGRTLGRPAGGLGSVRELRGLPLARWLGAQSRCLPAAP
jgi:hypothetical protein